MLGLAIDIQLNIRRTSVSKLLNLNLANNRYSAQHSSSPCFRISEANTDFLKQNSFLCISHAYFCKRTNYMKISNACASYVQLKTDHCALWMIRIFFMMMLRLIRKFRVISLKNFMRWFNNY